MTARFAVIGVDGVVGRGVAARLVSIGHHVVGIASQRPIGWPGSVDFVHADGRDAAAMHAATAGADAVAHCAWSGGPVVAFTDIGRIVLVTSTGIDRLHPSSARVEERLTESGTECVVVRCATVMGRDVDDPLLSRFTAPVVADTTGGHPFQVVHPEDVQRLVVRTLLKADNRSGTIRLAAAGVVTVRQVAIALRRPYLRIPNLLAGRQFRVIDSDYPTVWTAQDCVEDFRLAARGRLSVGSRIVSLPWRLPRVRDVPASDVPADDGLAPVAAGLPGMNGEFDTPIDPRFPAFVATNLSEALPGPFSPSSASVTVRGTKAAGMVIAERLRPGGIVQREMAVRTTGVFAHRLYAGITSAYYMAETMPVVKSDSIVEGFFGRTAHDLVIFGAERPPPQPRGVGPLLRSIASFGTNLIGLTVGARTETRDFVSDVDHLESLASEPDQLDDDRLRALIVLARDHVVHGWVLSSASILVCTAYGVILRALCGYELTPAPGPEVASAQSLGAVQRLAAIAHSDPDASDVLKGGDGLLDALARRAPGFLDALKRELTVIGHRGPAEVEMRSPVYADDPELLARIVARALEYVDRAAPSRPDFPLPAKPVANLAAQQLRDREVRRDKMVRAIWVLRNLLRECGTRLETAGHVDRADDVFYLLVDELDARPANLTELVRHRRLQQRNLAAIVPPEAFTGNWEPSRSTTPPLRGGDVLRGLGVCVGRAKGRVRVITAESIDDLQPREVLVTKVADVGYTPAFSYAAAVVTELGGPLSHAAIVAREFAVPCVVNARDATDRLPLGALVEVDGTTGEITVLDE